MVRICPKPMVRIFHELRKRAVTHPCTPPEPPTPLILSGWLLTNDIEKLERWKGTVAWAERNGCSGIVHGIADEDFYEVETSTTYEVGPTGGPLYRPWDFDERSRPADEDLRDALQALQSDWTRIVGQEIGVITRPLTFTGNKGRRLVVSYTEGAQPPWGSWSELSPVEDARRAFTRFRAAINQAIAPHEVDHIDFTAEGARPG